MHTFSDENKARIKSLAQQLRYKYDAMEWGVTPDYLIKEEGLDYGEYNLKESSLIKKITKRIRNLVKIIKAAIVVKEKIVLIDKDLHPKKKLFGKAHELGHHAIPEHRAIFYVCSEHDLNPQTVKEIEFEASLFASEILFPQPLIESIYKDYPLSMESILQLANFSKASFHAAAIKYVQDCDKLCCLLVLKVDSDEEGNKGLRLKHQCFSKSWWKKYGKLLKNGQFLSKDHNLSQVVFSGNSENIVKNYVKTRNYKFPVHTFYNQYIVLALLLEHQVR